MAELRNEDRNIVNLIQYNGRNSENKSCIVIFAQCRYSVFLISPRYVIMQNLHDGRPRNGTRNGAYYCSAKSTAPFEGGCRFKVELLSFDITGGARALFSEK